MTNHRIIIQLAAQNILDESQAGTPELKLERLRQQAALCKISQGTKLNRQSSANVLDVPEDDRLKSFHFDLGDSNDGPVGFCMRVRATSVLEAVETARDRMSKIQRSGELQDWLSPEEFDDHNSEYIQAYFNYEAIGPQDISEWEYVDDE